MRVDAARLIERLRVAYDADALPGAFKRMYLDERDDAFEVMLRAFPGEAGAEVWKRELAGYASPDVLGVSHLLIAWLNAGRDLRDACRFACLAPSGPRFEPGALVDALASTWVAIPPPVRELVQVSRTPSGAPHSVASPLESFLLDAAEMARHLCGYVDPPTLQAQLSEIFGDAGPALAARLLDTSAKLEEQLCAQERDLERFVERVGKRAADDTEALATMTDLDAMGPNQRAWVQAVAWHVMKAVATMRGDPKTQPRIADARSAKSLIVRIMSENSPTLTEDTWDIILAEEDTDVLAWWVALASLRAYDHHPSRVRPALFENPELRRYAMAIGRDERQMAEIGEKLEQARAEQKT